VWGAPRWGGLRLITTVVVGSCAGGCTIVLPVSVLGGGGGFSLFLFLLVCLCGILVCRESISGPDLGVFLFALIFVDGCYYCLRLVPCFGGGGFVFNQFPFRFSPDFFGGGGCFF